jgi:hypothetical protein
MIVSLLGYDCCPLDVNYYYRVRLDIRHLIGVSGERVLSPDSQLESARQTQHLAAFPRATFTPHARRAHLTYAKLAARSSRTLKFGLVFTISTFSVRPCGSQ